MSDEQRDLKPPQLRMRLTGFDGLPDGYRLRTFSDGDDARWPDVLDVTEGFGRWDLDRARDWLQGDLYAVKDGIFFIDFGKNGVATACTFARKSCDFAELGWVAVLPPHQGKRLGFQVSLAVLSFAKKSGYSETFRNTNDRYLPAVRTYLNLGFEPVMTHRSHPGRWKSVLEHLNQTR